MRGCRLPLREAGRTLSGKRLGENTSGSRSRDGDSSGDVCSVDNFEAVFLDDCVGEDFFGDVFELFLGLVARPTVEVQNEEFSLANVTDGRVAEARQRVLNGLSLGIKDGAFWHDPDVCFHAKSIAAEVGVALSLI